MDPARTTSLLQRYTSDRSEDAFRALVDGCAGMMYATALRRTGGNTALAEDATQMAFITLARRASRIRGGDHLPPWLHLDATRHAISLMRSESASRRREKTAHLLCRNPDPDPAADSKLPLLLDDSLLSLPYEDRRLLTLRYLEGRNLRAVGEAEGISENAAGKRVHKALQKLPRTLESCPGSLGKGHQSRYFGFILGSEVAEGKVPDGYARQLLSSLPVEARQDASDYFGKGMSGGEFTSDTDD